MHSVPGSLCLWEGPLRSLGSGLSEQVNRGWKGISLGQGRALRNVQPLCSFCLPWWFGGRTSISALGYYRVLLIFGAAEPSAFLFRSFSKARVRC